MRLQLEQREARTRQLMQAQQVPATEVGDKLQLEVEDTGRRGVSNLPAWMTKGDGAAAERVQAEARNWRRTKPGQNTRCPAAFDKVKKNRANCRLFWQGGINLD